MTQNNDPTLVDIDWLRLHDDQPELRLLDARFFLPNEQRDAHAEYLREHLPEAVFFDIDAICDPDNPLPHMLPDPQRFGDLVGQLGIGNKHHVICYDDGRYLGACRAWWAFRIYGHDRVSVLDGGLPAWRAAGLPLDSGAVSVQATEFKAFKRDHQVADLAQVRQALASGASQIVDARSAERFAGTAPEPRPGLRAGHMPGALNLPFNRLIGPDGKLRDRRQLEQLFRDASVRDDLPVIASCGSGVSAAVLLLGLHLLGRSDISLYDGSWAEWGGREDTTVAS